MSNSTLKAISRAAGRSDPRGHKETLKREGAYDRLLLAIILGELEPGSRVEERDLSQRFGFGQAGVRDALARLALEGLVERKPRIGTQIADLTLRELHNLFEARAVIEVYAACLAGERATEEDFAAMRAALREFPDAVKARDFARLVRLDQRFHRALAAACKNPELERTLVRMHNSAARFWCFGIQRMSERELLAQADAHEEIVEAVEKRDPVEIEARIRKAIAHLPDSRFFIPEPSFSLSFGTPALGEGR